MTRCFAGRAVGGRGGVVEHRQHQHVDLGCLAGDGPRGIDPVDAGHVQVEDDDDVKRGSEVPVAGLEAPVGGAGATAPPTSARSLV